MASRSRTTFAKRQKELARMQKQRDKAAKRMQRKAERRPLDAEPLEAVPDMSQEAGTAPTPSADDLT